MFYPVKLFVERNEIFGNLNFCDQNHKISETCRALLRMDIKITGLLGHGGFRQEIGSIEIMNLHSRGPRAVTQLALRHIQLYHILFIKDGVNP